MVQRTGAQAESRVTLIQNNLFHDAFFLKATSGSASARAWSKANRVPDSAQRRV